MTQIEKNILVYVDFKIKQFARITGFTLTRDNIEDFKKTIKPRLKGWVREAKEAKEVVEAVTVI